MNVSRSVPATGKAGGSSAARTPSARVGLAPRHSATARQFAVSAAPRKDTYYDFAEDVGSLDSLDAYGTQFEEIGSYTAPLPQQPRQQPAQTYPSYNQYPYGRSSGAGYNSRYYQRAPVYLPNSSMDEWEDDIYPIEEELEEQPARQEPRFINGRQYLCNREITSSTVRVISGEGGKTMRGVMTLEDALATAKAAGVDLVMLNPDATPPLCRLVVWSKYKYEVEKDLKKRAAKSANVETKEVRLRPSTDSGDLATKLKSAQKFLDKGNKVKLVMKFEGRELQFKEQGKQVMLKFIEDLAAVGKVDGTINFKTGTYTAVLSPTGKTAGGPAEPEPAPTPAPTAAAPSPTAAAMAAASGLPMPPPAPKGPPPPAGLPLPPNAPPRPASPAGPQTPRQVPLQQPAAQPRNPLPMPNQAPRPSPGPGQLPPRPPAPGPPRPAAQPGQVNRPGLAPPPMPGMGGRQGMGAPLRGPSPAPAPPLPPVQRQPVPASTK